MPRYDNQDQHPLISGLIDKADLMVDDLLLRRVRAEFLEMPGLRLTSKQAERLWALDEATCVTLLGALSEIGFLMRAPDGRYSRLTDGADSSSRLSMAKSTLPAVPDRIAG